MNETFAPSAGQPGFAEATPDSAPVAPVSAAERIDTLDFIRGLAVMGILAANIVAFGQPFDAYFYPAAFMVDPADPGGWLWIAQSVLVDGKMRGLFTLLFGAGMYLFMERAWARGSTRALQAWRLAILGVFGMIHFFLIWPGDILFSYALFGLIVLACLTWSIKAQFFVGLGGYMLGVVYYGITFTSGWLIADRPFGMAVPGTDGLRDQLQGAVAGIIARGAVADAAILEGDYLALVTYRLTHELTDPLRNAGMFVFETLPLMLLGVALYRVGFFGGAIDRARMVRWGWAGLLAGGALHLAIGLMVREGGFSFYGTLAGLMGMSPLPRLWMVLGLAALLVAWAPSATGWLGDRIRAAGRAAFTNYLGTSVVMMFVFHGWALGLYGALNRPQLYLVMVLAWIVMLAWSKPWLERYRYGPLEWLWRCLTYRQVFALRR